MAGIRIRHITGVGPAVIAVRDLSEPFQPTRATYQEVWAAARGIGVTVGTTMGLWNGCSVCGLPPTPADHPMGHQGFKTRHIRVDADGVAIVSEGVWKELSKYVDNGGFELVNTVPDPPAVTIAFNKARGPHLTVHHKVPREIRSEYGDGGNNQLP